jgi:aconitate hydratase
LTFLDGETHKTLRLTGEEIIDITGIASEIRPGMTMTCHIKRSDGQVTTHRLLCRIDTQDEVGYFRNGGILPYVLRGLSGLREGNITL